MQITPFIVVVFAGLSFFLSVNYSHAVPLSTRSRWIVDEDTGKRVKLTCVNWEGHIEPMLPEGLHRRRLDDISRHFSLLGFNCVRLTYATHMFTRYAKITVEERFKDLNLTTAIDGLSSYNPELLGLTLPDAHRAVIESLGSHGVMVLLDCQVSKPMWCCNLDDGNGFFGDRYFDPRDWLQALSIVARRYKNTPMVMAMSLRNEFRGARQNETVWHHYVEKGAKTIHRANPNVLVLVSGLDYDTNFVFLKKKPLKFTIGKKLVYEAHRYSFTDGADVQWSNNSLVNQLCENTTREIEENVGFLRRGENPAPLFVTEFGGDETGVNEADNNFVSCYLSWLAKNELDWALWAGQGSYYLRDGKHDPEETYGILDSTWENLRSPAFYKKLQPIMRTFQDPFSKHTKYNHSILYHPLSGNCGVASGDQVYSGDCMKPSKWIHRGEGTPIRLNAGKNNWCLTAIGDGLPAILTDDCTSEKSTWKLAPNSKYQLANKDEYGNDLCLEWDPQYSKVILTKKCIVNGKVEDGGDTKLRNPQRQWFILVESNLKFHF